MREPISAMICTILWAVASAEAQTTPGLIDLTVDRPLTQSDLDILARVIDQNSVTDVARSLGEAAPTLAEACNRSTPCMMVAMERFRSAERLASILSQPQDPGGTLGWTGNVVIDLPLPGLPGGGVVITNVATSTDVPDLRAVPIDLFGTIDPQGTRDEVISAFVAPVSPPVQLIETDIARFGISRRSFAIRPDISDADLTAAIVALKASGLDASRLPDDADPPASLIEPLDVVAFEAQPAAGESCARDAAGRPWPFDPAPVIEVLRDNQRVMDKLKLPIERALIVVADTGLGKGVLEAEDGRFFAFLAPSPKELLNPLLVFKNDLGLPGSKSCIDNDGDKYFGNLYGAQGSDITKMDQCSATPETGRFDARLFPIARRPDATEIYEPSHGSFVATLSAGGVDLIEAYPPIARQVGLRVFKTTRPTEVASTKSVRVDPTDITGAIDYALFHRAAVLNMSMKTTDDLSSIFTDRVDKADTLVVVSAGNKSENLDIPASGVFPAGLTSDHLIVVGGLDNDAGHSWWTKSASGELHVEIAAPAVRVRSLDEDGNGVCYTGTSAAAPLVSFTGAVLLSYGLFDARGAKTRILSSATMEPDGSLKGKVRNGRRLDIAAALDIFFDRVTTAEGTRRGRILSPTSSERLLSICDRDDATLAGTGGLMDPASLVNWSRSGDRASFALVRGENDLGHCRLPHGAAILFQEVGSDRAVQVSLEEITSIVFSSFRSDEVQNAVLFGD